jgi:hypothetical protein
MSGTPEVGSGAIELRLHKATYMAQAVRDAIKVFDGFARFELARDGDHYLVKITDLDPEVDGDIAAELANFALVHTIERKRRTPGVSGSAQ